MPVACRLVSPERLERATHAYLDRTAQLLERDPTQLSPPRSVARGDKSRRHPEATTRYVDRGGQRVPNLLRNPTNAPADDGRKRAARKQRHRWVTCRGQWQPP